MSNASRDGPIMAAAPLLISNFPMVSPRLLGGVSSKISNIINDNAVGPKAAIMRASKIIVG